MKKQQKVPAPKLRQIMKGQVEDNIRRSDVRLASDLSNYVLAQEGSLERTSENCASIQERFDLFSKQSLDSADRYATKKILEAYGIYGR